MSDLIVPDSVATLEKQLAKAGDRVSTLHKKLHLAKSDLRVRCLGRRQGGALISAWTGCQRDFPIKDVTFYQKWYYVNEPYNEHHETSGGEYECPNCGVRTRFLNNSDIQSVSMYWGKKG